MAFGLDTSLFRLFFCIINLEGTVLQDQPVKMFVFQSRDCRKMSEECNVSSTFFGRQEEKLDVKNEKVEFIFPTFFVKVAALPFPAKAKLLFFQCFLPRNVSKSSFFWKKPTFSCLPEGG